MEKLFNKLKIFLPIVLIIALALFLRGYNLERRSSFDADQEEIAGRAADLISGHPVLLGPKTSLGGFSIGPGFTYVWGFFSVFTKGDPIAGAYASTFLGVSFVLFLYFFTRKLYSERTALALSLIGAFSMILIVWDQSPWAPSLFYLSEILIMYGLYISNKKTLGVFLVFLGFAIGFQAHFTIFLLPPAVLIYWLIFKPKLDKKWLIYSLVVVICGFMPVIIFDLTHHFVNLERLLSVFRIVVSGTPPPTSKVALTLIANSVGFFYMSFSEIQRILIFLFVIAFSVIGIAKETKYRKGLSLALLFLFVPFIFFLFYRSNFSEYYLMSALPSVIILTGYVFEKLDKYYVVTVAIVILLAFLNIKIWKVYTRSINLWAKKQVVQTIIEMGGKSGYGVSLSVEPGFRFGFPFLFRYYGATPDIPPISGQKKIFTIIVPTGYKDIKSMKTYDAVGLRWQGV